MLEKNFYFLGMDVETEDYKTSLTNAVRKHTFLSGLKRVILNGKAALYLLVGIENIVRISMFLHKVKDPYEIMEVLNSD